LGKHANVRAASHYDQRSRDSRFPPITRNQVFGLSTLHTRDQSPKTITLQNAFIKIFFNQSFDQSDRTIECENLIWLTQTSFSEIGMETQTIVKRRQIFSLKKKTYILLPIFKLIYLNFQQSLTTQSFSDMHDEMRFGSSTPKSSKING